MPEQHLLFLPGLAPAQDLSGTQRKKARTVAKPGISLGETQLDVKLVKESFPPFC